MTQSPALAVCGMVKQLLNWESGGGWASATSCHSWMSLSQQLDALSGTKEEVDWIPHSAEY